MWPQEYDHAMPRLVQIWTAKLCYDLPNGLDLFMIRLLRRGCIQN